MRRFKTPGSEHRRQSRSCAGCYESGTGEAAHLQCRLRTGRSSRSSPAPMGQCSAHMAAASRSARSSSTPTARSARAARRCSKNMPMPTPPGSSRTNRRTCDPLSSRRCARGIQVQTHAIGDRGNRLVLDLYEEVFKAVPPDERKVREPRWRIEHAQVISPPDIPRFAKLGVIPSMQPSHAISDLFFAPSRLGKERLAGAYAWQSLIKSRRDHSRRIGCAGRARRADDRVLRRGGAQEPQWRSEGRLASGRGGHARAGAEDVHGVAGLSLRSRRRTKARSKPASSPT